MISVEIQGLDKLQSMFAPGRLTREMDPVIGQAASIIRDMTKTLPPVSAKRTGYAALGIPVATGHMRQAIQQKKLFDLSYQVYANTNYSRYVSDGTSRMPARPFFAWTLTEFGGLKNIETLITTALERLYSS